MKKSLSLMLMLAVWLSAFAQPVIQNGNNLPDTGFTGGLMGAANVSPGSSGANHTWDFTTTTFNQAGSFEVVDPSTGYQYNTYSTANFAIKFNISGMVMYQYFRNAADSLEIIGSDVTTSSGKNYNTNGSKVLQYPFSHTNTYLDYYKKQGSSTDFFYATYDGYGTLKIDTQTYTNVVRVEYNYSGDKDYIWWSVNPLLPVLRIGHDGQAIYFNIGAAQSTGIAKQDKNYAVSIYPNPVKDFLNVDITAKGNTDFTLFNITGKAIMFQQLQNGSNSIDVTKLDQGIYFYMITENGSGVKTGKIVID